MGATVHAMLFGETSEITQDRLVSDLKKYFSKEKNLSISIQENPFNNNTVVHMLWDNRWGTTIFEEDRVTMKGSVDNIKEKSKNNTINFNEVTKILRITFGTDGDNFYNDKTVEIITFFIDDLKSLIWDQKRNRFVK